MASVLTAPSWSWMTRSQRAAQLDHDLLRLDALEPVAQELRIEADLKWFAVEVERERLVGFADVRSLGRDAQLAGAETKTERGVLLCEQADPPDYVGKFLAGEKQLVLGALGQ